ncbi:MAG: hypothetical protein M1819_006678 [Sarea resinae]|nr:MAG: hypothetical protein M1819_006678 [Sarea resinae]
MRYHGGWPASTGRALFVLSSIARYASAAAISSSSSVYYSNFTLPVSTATTYDAEPLSILPNGAGIVVDSSKTISLGGNTTAATYTLSDGCVMSAVKQGGSVVIVPGKACSNSAPITSSTPSSSSTNLPPSTSNSIQGTNSTAVSSSSISLPSTARFSNSSTSSSTGTGSSSRLSSSPILASSSAGTGSSPRPSSSSGSSSTAIGSSNSTSAIPSVTLGIITSIIVESGTTVREPIITGGGLSSPITLPAATTTIASSQATSAVSSVSSQIVGLIPVINSWKASPTPLKTDTLNKVKSIKSDVEDLISDLGSDSSSKPCGSKKKKRGLLGPISDVVSSLSCIDEDLDNITDSVNADDTEGVESTLDDLTSENDDLTDDGDDNNSSSNTNSKTSTGTSKSTGSSSGTSSSSSCTSTQTALRVTVLCIPTTYTTGGSTVSTTTCSPTTTVTTSGCSVTGTTTTVSSSASSSATQTPCASDTCGGACPLGGGPLSGASMGIIATTEDCSLISTSTTSALPTASYGVAGTIAVASPTDSTNAPSKRGFSSDPTDSNETLGDISNPLFERALPDVTPPYTNYVRGLSQGATWVSQQGDASGHWYDYPIFGHAAVGVNGIYGCTAVIISSEKGVYLSHIWENPVFIDSTWASTDDASFTTKAFNSLRDGTANALSITSLIGTDAQPGVLNAIYSPKVFVLTPRTTDFDRNNFQITTTLRYQARAQDLANKIAGILPGSGGTGFTLGYTRTSAQASTQNPGTAGRAILEVDPFQSWLTTTASGVDPTSPGLQIGRWRLWVEDQLITYQDFWLPHTTPPTGTIQQRDVGYANPCSGYTSNSTGSSSSSSATSSGASKTSSSSNGASTGSSSSSPSANSTQISSTTNSATKASTSSGSGPSSTSTMLIKTTKATGSSSPLSSISPSAASSSGHSVTSTASSTYSITSSPPISSCTLTSQAALSTGDINIPATIACACNDGWQAGVGTTVGPDKATTYTCEVGTTTRIAVSTTVPPITSCALTSQAALSTGDINVPATIACACNDGWQAGVGTTVGPDKATTYTCEVGTTTRIAVSTSSPPPAYATGTCDLHIFEASLSYNEPLYVQLNITDGANALLASQNYQLHWGDSASVAASDSHLPYDLSVDFLNRTTIPTSSSSRRFRGRMVAPPPPQINWEDWVLTLTAGSTEWDDTDTDSSRLPYCSVGGWDNGNFWDWLDSATSLGADQHSANRQMDCHWAC